MKTKVKDFCSVLLMTSIRSNYSQKALLPESMFLFGSNPIAGAPNKLYSPSALYLPGTTFSLTM